MQQIATKCNIQKNRSLGATGRLYSAADLCGSAHPASGLMQHNATECNTQKNDDPVPQVGRLCPSNARKRGKYNISHLCISTYFAHPPCRPSHQRLRCGLCVSAVSER